MFTRVGACWPTGIGMLAVVIAAFFQIYCIQQPFIFLVDEVLGRDDVYYYFGISRNLAQTGIATFDGVHLSNGVQLAWALILVPLAWLFENDVAFIRSVLVLSVAFNVAAGYLFFRLGREILSPAFGDIAALLWAGYMVELFHTLHGIEFSLHICIILLVIWSWWEVTRKINAGKVGSLALHVLGFLLAFNFWVRLDSVVFSIAIWISVCASLYGHTDRRGLMGSIAILTLWPFLGAIAYVATSYAMAETLLPISGTVKAWYGERYFEGVDSARAVAMQVGWWFKVQLSTALALIPTNIGEIPLGQPLRLLERPGQLALAILIIVVTCWIVWRIRTIEHPERGAVMRIAAGGSLIWVVAGLHIPIMILSIADFSHVTRHYYGWLIVFWFGWGSLAAVFMIDAMARWRLGRAICWCGIAGMAIIYVDVGVNQVTGFKPGAPTVPQSRVYLAEWMRENLPPDAIIGSWNAGQLGFLASQTVVNLDGLANDAAYFEFMSSGAPIEKYLKNEGITHLIDYNERDLSMAFTHSWDRDVSFRGVVKWDDVNVLKKEGILYVLELDY